MPEPALLPLCAAALWLLAANCAAFVLFGADKARARREARRIPEKTLFTAALLGGSAGAIAGMFHFRHKTLHKRFRLGLPLILAAQAVLAVAILIYGGLFHA